MRVKINECPDGFTALAIKVYYMGVTRTSRPDCGTQLKSRDGRFRAWGLAPWGDGRVRVAKPFPAAERPNQQSIARAGLDVAVPKMTRKREAIV